METRIETGNEVAPVNAELAIDIHDEESNFYVCLPKNVAEWKSQMEASLKERGRIVMQVSTLAHGCGACAIGFFPEQANFTMSELEHKRGFGVVVNKQTLKAIKDVIDFAYDHFH